MAARVSISIVGRVYEISCDDGQEDYVRTLAQDIDRRALDLQASVGLVGDARLLLMVALLMADEMAELKRRLQRGVAPGPEIDTALAAGIEAVARRIDAIAERIQNA